MSLGHDVANDVLKTEDNLHAYPEVLEIHFESLVKFIVHVYCQFSDFWLTHRLTTQYAVYAFIVMKLILCTYKNNNSKLLLVARKKTLPLIACS